MTVPGPGPVSVTVTSPTTIAVSWGAASAAVAGYRLTRNGSLIHEQSELSYADAGLTPATRYCYTVRAYDAGGHESAPSAEQCGTTGEDPVTVPGPGPVSVTVTSPTTIAVNWGAASGAVAGYRLTRNGSLIHEQSELSYADAGLTPATRYCYTVRAYDAGGHESAPSAEQCGTTGAAGPTHALTVSWSGSGAGAVVSEPAGIDCGATCSAGFAEGAVVTLRATTQEHYHLAGWQGCDSESRTTCTVTLSQDRAVTAYVFGNAVGGRIDGAVYEGVTVTLSSGTTTLGTTTTDGQGEYMFDALPNGTYTVRPALDGYDFDPPSQDATIADDYAEVPAFTATRRKIVSGLVGSAEPGAAAGVKLVLSAAGVSLTATTDATGRFTLPSAASGTYTLTPSKQGYLFSPASRTVKVSDDDIGDVHFAVASPGATVTIDYVEPFSTTFGMYDWTYYATSFTNWTSSTISLIGYQNWIVQGTTKRAAGGSQLYYYPDSKLNGTLAPMTSWEEPNLGFGTFPTNAGTGTLVPGPATLLVQLTVWDGVSESIVAEKEVPITLK